MSAIFKRRVVPKTASYSPNAATDQPGTIFTNRGATGAVTFTLPTPSRGYLGFSYEFRSVADQDLTVAGATAGDIATKNDQAANSVAVSTSGEKIGAALAAECIETADGTFKWLVYGLAVGHTYTVVT